MKTECPKAQRDEQRALKLIAWLLTNAHERQWTALDNEAGYCTSCMNMLLKVYRTGGFDIWDRTNGCSLLESKTKTSICEVIDGITKRQAEELRENRLKAFFMYMGVK